MFSLQDIYKHLPYDFSVEGNQDLLFSRIAPIFEADESSLSWVRVGNVNIDTIIRQSKASFIICEKNYEAPADILQSACLIKVERPDLCFLRLVKNLYRPANNGECAIHPTAIIHPDAVLGKNVSIGAFSIVDKCEIGDNSIIAPHCAIKENVFIKENVLISEFCNIGGQGFGHIRNEYGVLENMLHIGKVIIESDVDIFPYSNVDRATLSETYIGKGTKIDHYCHIGHNTKTGSGCIVTAKIVLCGGCSIGDNSFIGVGSVIRDSVKVGKGVTIGMGSMVTKNIPDNEVWIGSPAMEIGRYKLINKKG